MDFRKNILVINGSASKNSGNSGVIDQLVKAGEEFFIFTIFNQLKSLPHFDADLSLENTPEIILEFRQRVHMADGIIIRTPEYIFSIPSGLKNALEWCVATTVFSDKPVGLITASASGAMGHAELQLIMETIMTKFIQETTLLIQGIKGKVNTQGVLTNAITLSKLSLFITAFRNLVNESNHSLL